MHDIDALSPAWRALVHEYGYKNVMAVMDDGTSIDDAVDALWMQRSARQAQWLSTIYVTAKTARSYG
jgi:tRNA A37 N6-isopentenylltransferase MiaA